MNRNERAQAFTILMGLMTRGVSLAQGLATTTEPMTKALCFGLCRHYVRLSLIADCLLVKRPKAVEVWIILLMGLYQIHYMNLPDYAVVKETVDLLNKNKKSWAKGLVNAVLRSFCRQKNEIMASLNNKPDFIYGHPQQLVTKIQKAWPNDWQKIALANDEHPPMTLRVHLGKSSVANYMNLLVEAGLEAVVHPLVPSAITLVTPCDVRQLPGFASGWVSVQDAAAQLAAPLLALHSGVRVLDACCAPGGKTCHLLEMDPGIESCIALDVDAKRLRRVEENLSRQGVKATVVHGDALHPTPWWDKRCFDRILLDAPCSATGVIRRHPDIKLLRTDKEIDDICLVQYHMLRSLWPLLAPNGIMVYATCSVIPEENEHQIARFVADYADCQILPITAGWGRATQHGRQILPGEHGMDGFFYSILMKNK